MTDIRIFWTADRGDWTLTGGAIEMGDDLESAILISLFTDRLATTDFKPTDGTNDRRGWWGDSYADADDVQIGSRLWQLERSKKLTSTLNKAREYCAESLQWLIDDGVVSVFKIDAEWQNSTRLALRIAATRPDGSTRPFNFSFAWVGTGV